MRLYNLCSVYVMTVYFTNTTLFASLLRFHSPFFFHGNQCIANKEFDALRAFAALFYASLECGSNRGFRLLRKLLSNK